MAATQVNLLRNAHTASIALGALGALLALALLLIPALPANAVYYGEQPGTGSPESEGFETSWKPAPELPRVAQTFEQLRDGALNQMRLEINGAEQAFASAALFDISSTGEIGAGNHLADAIISTAPGAAGLSWVVLDFPDQPQLRAGNQYALVIDPHLADDASTTVSFHAKNFFDPASPFETWNESASGWQFFTRGTIVFTSTILVPYAETHAPTLASNAPCGTLPTVVLPVDEGVSYASSYDESARLWRITATIDAGYLDDGAQQLSWELPAAVAQCPPTVSPDPELPPTTPPTQLAATGGEAPWLGLGLGATLLLLGAALLGRDVVRGLRTRA